MSNEAKVIRTHKISSNSDGKCFINGFFTLKWKYCAATIIEPIIIDGISTNEEYQIPTISNVDKAILVAPTKLLVKSLNPNCLNSFIMLSNLNIQTKITDAATISCDNVM